MAVIPGTRLGPYEITAQIGVGGMGEVYRAMDTNLKRAVAIKVLPELVAEDRERLARFQREAEVLASLNHPNIAAIYGLERSDGVTALVMELVEGPTLAERIARGPIPVDEALPIARQIAEALEAAHEHAVIHRDLKPANIKVRDDGTVKVLDFGLAKALEPMSVGMEATASPTITSPAMTQRGVILGTAAYMSPEQARGQAVDRRTDLWAFGCIVYQMLAGRPAFSGSTVSDTIARILEREPEWDVLPRATPAGIRRLLRRCLAKDRRQRLSDAADARLEIEEAQTAPADEAAPPVRGVAVGRMAGLAAAVALLTGGSVAGMAVWLATRPAPPVVTRFTITPPAASPLTVEGTNRDLAISPDGRRLVYVAANGTQLVVHSLDRLAPTILTGIGRPSNPVFSPDGQWIAFYDGVTALKKVSATGGSPITLSPIKGPPFGLSWGSDDTIFFTGGDRGGLLRVGAAGGQPTVLTSPDRALGEAFHNWPEVLPGGETVLFNISSGPGPPAVGVLDLTTGTRKVLLRGGSQAHYVAPGYLVYNVAGTLWAVAFDLGRLAVSGPPVPVVEGVVTTGAARQTADFSVAPNGTLIYVPDGGATTARRTLTWVDRQGREAAVVAPARAYVYPRLSPDSMRLAVAIADQENDIWMWDIPRQRLTRFTFNPAFDLFPVWTPDGRRLVWGVGSVGGGPPDLYWQEAAGTGTAERLTETPDVEYPLAITPDETRLVLRRDGPGTGQDLWMMALSGDRRLTPLIQTAFNERNGEISADGRWLAYESNESGRDDIYVRPFPAIDTGRWQVSTGGGRQPLWARSGRELFYRAPDGAVMRVGIESGDGGNQAAGFNTDTPVALVRGQYYSGSAGLLGRTYDVSADGRRFLMIREGGGSDASFTGPTVVVVQNWVEELKRLVPTN